MSVMDSAELKGLQTQRAKAEGELRGLNSELSELQRKVAAAKGRIADLNRRIDSFNEVAEPTVSEHAMLRYCERVLGMDLENVRKAILTPDVVKKINFMVSGKIKSDSRHELIVKNRVVVTVE